MDTTKTNRDREAARRLEDDGLEWLKSVGCGGETLQPMAGDISSRRYFRVQGQLLILAHYPADLRRSYECFLRTDELLKRVGVATPSILAIDRDRRWMLTRDLGNRQLATEREPGLVHSGMQRARVLASRIERLETYGLAGLSPSLSTELLTREVRRSCELYFREQLAAGESAVFEPMLFALCGTLGEGPLLPAHRDYMARNLMVKVDPLGRLAELVVLDHQDLRLAPKGYDLASLYFDSCPLSPQQASTAVDQLVANDSERTAIARCAVQRCIKIVGTFVGFARAGQSRYLSMVPVALQRAAQEVRRLPEGSDRIAAILERCAASSEGSDWPRSSG